MVARTKLESKLIFDAVRSGAFRTLRETDLYYANGLVGNASGILADSTITYDADHTGGANDDGSGNIIHGGNLVVKRAVKSLGTLDVEGSFVEGGATAYEELVLGADGSYTLAINGAGYVEQALTGDNIANLGFPNFSAPLLHDGLTVVASLDPNGAAIGAQVRLQFTVAKTLNRFSMFMSGAGHTCVYKVEASSNKLQWVTLGSNYIPVLAGYNNFDFLNTTAYKYYRLVLTGRTLAAEVTTCTELKVWTTDQCFLINGIEVYDLSKMQDGNFVNTAFDTNGMPANSYVGFKMAAAQAINKISLYMDGAGYTSTFTIKASNDMVMFDTLSAAFGPAAAGWNACEFVNDTAYKYYILELDTDVAVEAVTCTEFAAEYTGTFFTYSGLTSFDGAKLHDGVTGVAAIDVNGAAAGSWWKLHYPVATVLNKISFFMSGAGHTSTYKFQGSNDNAIWTDLVAAYAPVNADWNAEVFANTTAYEYYRFLLNENLPVEVRTFNEIKLERQYITKYTSDLTSGYAGATCLGVLKNHDGAADYVLTHTLGAPVDLTGVDYVYFWAKSDVVEAGAASVTISQVANDYTTAVDIADSSIVGLYFIDLSAVADLDKNAIDTVTVTIGMASENKRIWFDGLIGSFFGRIEMLAPNMAPVGDYIVQVLRMNNTAAPPVDEGDVYIQLSGDGFVWENVTDTTLNEIVTKMLVPKTEYDEDNGTGTWVNYTIGEIDSAVGTFVNDFGVASDTYIRILFTGHEVGIAGVLYEKV